MSRAFFFRKCIYTVQVFYGVSHRGPPKNFLQGEMLQSELNPGPTMPLTTEPRTNLI